MASEYLVVIEDHGGEYLEWGCETASEAHESAGKYADNGWDVDIYHLPSDLLVATYRDGGQGSPE